jgi:phosphoserine phosphatase RsbU/P
MMISKSDSHDCHEMISASEVIPRPAGWRCRLRSFLSVSSRLGNTHNGIWPRLRKCVNAILSSSWLARFIRQQALYLSIAAVGVAIFWAIGQRINPATMVLYALCVGNLITPSMNRVNRMFCGRPFPFNWLTFLAALVVLTPAVYVVARVVVCWLAPPSPQSLGHLITTGWKFPCLLILVCGVISFLYTETKQRLERRNVELQRTVELSAAQLEMQEQELERAREIQQSLLPKDIPQLSGFEVATAWRQARMVGGDYFDVLRLGKNRLAICIADVVGKGVPAALLMANVQAGVRAFARDSESPAWVCSHVNSVLCRNIASEKFVTFFYGVLDADKRTLQYCNAGHPCPVLVSGESIRRLRAGGAVLGVFPGWKYEDSTVELKPGDRLVLFTDGITEASESDGLEFGEDHLAAIAKASSGSSATELNARVLAQVTEFCQGQFQDDATLLVIAVNYAFHRQGRGVPGSRTVGTELLEVKVIAARRRHRRL